MAKDIERELDAILSHHKARVAEARNEATGKNSGEEDFSKGATNCLISVITPALQQMAQALNGRGVAARVLAGESDARIDIPVSKHARLGGGHGGYPFLRARPDNQTRRMHFEQNTSDSRGASAIGSYPLAEVDAEMVRVMVLDLVRTLYGPF